MDLLLQRKDCKVDVAKLQRSDHVFLHLLCKSHICEKSDLTNIQIIAKIKVNIGLQEKVANPEPELKSYLQKKVCCHRRCHSCFVIAAAMRC